MRKWYVLAAIGLLGVEICIALFVHDNFIRPYLGDVLVTELLCCLCRPEDEARFAGLRSVSYDGKTVTYGSDVELAAAIRDLEGRIATASATPRRRRWGTVATKGL